MEVSQVRVLVKLKKSKNPRKTRIGQTTPTHPINQFFILTFGNIKTIQKTRKTTQFPPKKQNPSWGLTHPPTSGFSRIFWIFFNLTKPLKAWTDTSIYTYVVLTLTHRLRSIKTTLVKKSVFAWLSTYGFVDQISWISVQSVPGWRRGNMVSRDVWLSWWCSWINESDWKYYNVILHPPARVWQGGWI